MFEAHPGRSLFSDDSDKCHCHVESLLQPPRQLKTSVAGSASIATTTGQRRTGITGRNGGSVAGSLIHGIASRLRARSNVSVKYRDDDDEDTDVADYCGNGDSVDNDVAYLDDDDDFDVCDEDVDEGNSVSKRNSFAGDQYCGTGSLDVLHNKMESLAPAGMDRILIEDDDIDDDTSSVNDEADDAEWSPKKPVHRTRIKRTQTPVCLKFKVKTDPELDSELNAIQNDGASCDVTDSCESKVVIDNKRARKTSLASKSLSKKFKRVGHKKSRLQIDAKNGVRSGRSKDGPKWEKKASILLLNIILRLLIVF